MIGILVISHGLFSTGLLDSVEMIAGAADNTASLSLTPGITTDCFEKMIKRKVEELDQGEGVLVFTDLLGGTPFNVAGKLKRELPIEIVVGMNLPMVLFAIFERETSRSIYDLAKKASCQENCGIVHFEIKGRK